MTRKIGKLNPNKIGTREQSIANEDYTFAHNDGNEILLSHKGTGWVSWDSPWDLANMLRYTHACRQVHLTAARLKLQRVKVLDVGCSSATFADFWRWAFRTIHKTPLTYLGLEVDEKTVQAANEVCEGLTKRCVEKWASVRQHDLIARNLPIDFKPDVILANEVIEHIPQKAAKKFFKQAHALLPEGGTLFITTPNPRKPEQQFVWPESHVYEWAKDELIEELEKVGFTITKQFGWFSQAKDRKDMTDEQQALYEQLRECSTGVASAVIGFLYPEHAQCVCLTCTKDAQKPAKTSPATSATTVGGDNT